MAAVVIRLTAGSGSWTVPADWNDADNSVEVRGAGASAGGSVSGSGAAAAVSYNLDLTPGDAISYTVAPQTIPTNPDNPTAGYGNDGGSSWFGASTFAASLVAAVGGVKGNANTGAGVAGGQASNCIGQFKFSGGRGGDSLYVAGGGGGGAATKDGNGQDGENADSTSGNRPGGAGGNNGSGVGGGARGEISTFDGSTANNAGPGTDGGGGGGAGGSNSAPRNTGNGADGGAGGGGAGASAYSSTGTTVHRGGEGVIIITYNPVASGPTRKPRSYAIWL